LVVTSTEFRYYLDGTTYSITSLSGVPVTTCPSGVVTIGGRSPGVTSPVAATISNVVFFDYAMTAAQASAWSTNTLCQESVSVVSTQLTSASKVVTFVPPNIVSGVSSLQGCVRMASRSQTYLFSNSMSATSTDKRYALMLDGANRRFRFFSNGVDVLGTTTTSLIFDDGTWHSVAVVTDATSAIFYVDGQYYGVASLPATVVPQFQLHNLVGDRQPAGSFRVNGAINYVKIHNFNLSPSQAALACAERAAPATALVTLQSSTVTAATLVSTSSLNVVDDYFVSACVKMTSGSQSFALANSVDNASDNRCLAWFFSGVSPKSIRLFSNGQSITVTNSTNIFDNNTVKRMFMLVQGRIVTFYVGGVIFGSTAFPVDIVPCLATGVTYVGGRPPNGALSISGSIGDVRFGNYADLSGVNDACGAKSDEDVEEVEVEEIEVQATAKTLKSVPVEDAVVEVEDNTFVIVGLSVAGVALVALVAFGLRRRTA
jgi:hypothetical protein